MKWGTIHRHGRRMPTIAGIGRGSEHEDGYMDHRGRHALTR
jgi:hypothetical protein